MKINTYTSLVGFLLTLSALQSGAAIASESNPNLADKPSIESRLDRLSAVLKERTEQAQENVSPEVAALLAGLVDLNQGAKRGFANGAGNRGWADGARGRGWADGAGNRGWADTARGGGWGNAGAGTFVNVNNPWRNGWADGGGFFNTY